MNKALLRIVIVSLMWTSGAVAGASGQVAGQPSAAGPQARVVVTVVRRNSRAPRVMTQANVLVFQQHQRRPVISWVRAKGSAAPLDLAVVVDDSLGSAFDNQIRDLREFVRSLPDSARVAVVYSTNSNANILQPFTADFERAARAFRLPLGRTNEVSSIYMAVADLFKFWPADPGRRRAILLVSDGIDVYRGIEESEPGNNPDLEQAIREVLRHGVTVYTIYASGAGFAHQNLFLLNNGQSCLSLLTLETGGEAFFQGLHTPVSFSPYLRQLNQLLSSQYVLTFKAAPLKKPGREPLHVTTELPGVELMAPTEVWVTPQ